MNVAFSQRKDPAIALTDVYSSELDRHRPIDVAQ